MHQETQRCEPKESSSARGWAGPLLVAGAALGWGTAYPATVLVLETLPPVGAAAWRGALSALVLALLLALTGRGETLRIPRRQVAPLVVLGIVGGALFTIGLNGSVLLAGPAVAAFGVGSFPVLMTLSAPLILGERLRRDAVVAVIAAGIGLVLLARELTTADPVGLALAGLASVAFSTYLNLSRRWGQTRGLHLAPTAVAAMVATAAVSVPLQAVLDPGGLVPAFTAAEAVGFAWLILPSGALSYLAALSGVQRLPAEYSSAFFFLVPLSGAAISVTLLGDRLNGLQILGGTLIVLAILVVTVPWRRALGANLDLRSAR